MAKRIVAADMTIRNAGRTFRAPESTRATPGMVVQATVTGVPESYRIDVYLPDGTHEEWRRPPPVSPWVTL